MPTLPESPFGLYDVEFRSQPSRTWRIDKSSDRIIGETDGLHAVRQAVEIILNVERFRWQIYQPYSGVQLDALIGQNPGYVGAELQKRINDALIVDDRVTGISGFEFSFRGTSLSASFEVTTIYGPFMAQTEVTLT